MKKEHLNLDCEHVETRNNLEDVLDSTLDVTKARNQANETLKTIERNAKKIFVAPGEK